MCFHLKTLSTYSRLPVPRRERNNLANTAAQIPSRNFEVRRMRAEKRLSSVIEFKLLQISVRLEQSEAQAEVEGITRCGAYSKSTSWNWAKAAAAIQGPRMHTQRAAPCTRSLSARQERAEEAVRPPRQVGGRTGSAGLSPRGRRHCCCGGGCGAAKKPAALPSEAAVSSEPLPEIAPSHIVRSTLTKLLRVLNLPRS